MKKTRLARAFLALFVLILTLGTAVGIYAATAADDGSAKIIAKNVELEAELSLVFAVDPANTTADDKLYLLVWDGERADGEYTRENAREIKTSFETAAYTINGVAGARLFKTDRIAIDNFQKTYYVRTCILRGEEAIYGELIPYSIETYALQRLSEGSVTPDQAELYYNVLRYALAADKVLNDGAQVEDKYVIFVPNGVSFGSKGAYLASRWFNPETNAWQMPFDTGCYVTDADGKRVDVTGELSAGIYTVYPKRCEHTFSDIASFEHISDTQHKRVCECGKEFVEDHVIGEWTSASDTQHGRFCDCGYAILENHSMGEWAPINSDKHGKGCDCGYALTEDHAWDGGVAAGGVTIYTCATCSKLKAETDNAQTAVVNPYANVNWSTVEEVKSMSHWHILTQAEFDMAIDEGYRHFAISHYQPSEPRDNLYDYFNNVPDNILSSPNSEKPNASNTSGDYHFNALGSYAVGGGHTAAEKANLLTWQELYDDTFANLKYPDGGGITINHPMYYPTQNMATIFAMLDYDERVLGVEMFNGDYGMFNPGNGQDKIYDTRYIDTWDTILATGRRCWGFAVIDWYSPNHKMGSNMLLAPEFTEEACLKAYRNGEFYMQVKDNGLKFTEIKYENGVVDVTVNKDAIIIFVTQDGDVKTVSGRSAIYVPTEDDIYVRVEVADASDPENMIFTNPFMFKTREEVAAAYDGSVDLKDGSVAYDINNSNVEGGTATTVVWEKNGAFTTTEPTDLTGYTKYTVEWYNYGTAGPNLDGTTYNITKRLEIKSIKKGDSTDEATITWGGKTYAAGDIVMRTSASHWLGCDAFMGYSYPSTVFKPSYKFNPIAKNGEIAAFEATFKIDLGDCHKNGEQYVLANFLSVGIRATNKSTPVFSVGFTATGTAENYIDVKGPSGVYYTADNAARGKVGEEFTLRVEIKRSEVAGNYTVRTLVNGILIDTSTVAEFDFNNVYINGIPALARDISVTMSNVKLIKYVDSYD